MPPSVLLNGFTHPLIPRFLSQSTYHLSWCREKCQWYASLHIAIFLIHDPLGNDSNASNLYTKKSEREARMICDHWELYLRVAWHAIDSRLCGCRFSTSLIPAHTSKFSLLYFIFWQFFDNFTVCTAVEFSLLAVHTGRSSCSKADSFFSANGFVKEKIDKKSRTHEHISIDKGNVTKKICSCVRGFTTLDIQNYTEFATERKWCWIFPYVTWRWE